MIGTNVSRPWVGKLGPPEETSGEELVVRGEEGGGIVEDGNAPRFQCSEGPRTVVDPFERRQHVQPSQNRVAGHELGERLLRRHLLPAEAVDHRGRERLVRRRRAAGDEREAHGHSYRTDERSTTRAVHRLGTDSLPLVDERLPAHVLSAPGAVDQLEE